MLTFASGLVVAFYRLWLGAALLTIVSYAVGQRLSWATLRHTWLGGVFLAGDMMLFYCAVRLTSIVDVTVIGAFQPALMLIAARKMFSERLGRWDVAWIVVAMAGVTIAVLGPSPAAHHRLAGDLLSVGALVSFSGYWIVSKRAREHTQAMEYTAGVTIMAAAVTTVVVLASSQALGGSTPPTGAGLCCSPCARVGPPDHELGAPVRRRVGVLCDQLPGATGRGGRRDTDPRSVPLGPAGGRRAHRSRRDRRRSGAQSTAGRTTRRLRQLSRLRRPLRLRRRCRCQRLCVVAP